MGAFFEGGGVSGWRMKSTHSWQSFARRFWKLIQSPLKSRQVLSSLPARQPGSHSLNPSICAAPLWFQLTYLCLCSIKLYMKNFSLSGTCHIFFSLSFFCEYALKLCVSAGNKLRNKSAWLGILSFDLRFYLAHILCDSRCASGKWQVASGKRQTLRRKICENLRKTPILNLALSLSFSFFCRTIPHLCRRLELRNWNSAIARSIHTIRRNLVSIKMQIFHLPVNWELPFTHSQFSILQLLFLPAPCSISPFAVTHSLIIGRRVWWLRLRFRFPHKKFITERQKMNLCKCHFRCELFSLSVSVAGERRKTRAEAEHEGRSRAIQIFKLLFFGMKRQSH